MRISDWSSDVCSSDLRCYSGINVLILWGAVVERGFLGQRWLTFRQALGLGGHVRKGETGTTVVYADQIGRASCRERVCQYVYISVVAEYLKKQKKKTIDETNTKHHMTN